MQNRIGIMFVCHGNICRSTMAEFVMQDIVTRAGYAPFFHIASSATSTEEIGNDTHPGTLRMLDAHGIPHTPRRAMRLKQSDAYDYDFIIGMDNENMRGIARLLGSAANKTRVYTLLEFAGIDRGIADPWYTGDFETTYDDVVTGCEALFLFIKRHMKEFRDS